MRTNGPTPEPVADVDDVRLVGDMLLDAADLLRGVFTDACSADDLTMPEVRTLRFLIRGARQSQLPDLLSCAPSRVTALLQSLEGAGLIRRQRSRGDKRQNEVRVTDDGVAAVVRIHDRLDEVSPLLLNLDADERQALRDLLLQLTGSPAGRDDSRKVPT